MSHICDSFLFWELAGQTQCSAAHHTRELSEDAEREAICVGPGHGGAKARTSLSLLGFRKDNDYVCKVLS